tara:strand:- start:8184 stop:9857 length:1674 start_codon:yes stop_codon:yes gene_type:complete
MKQIVVDLLKEVLKGKGIKLKDEEIEKYIEVPPSSELGDYAFPCFFLSAQLKESPHEIALEIREKIGDHSADFDDIQTSGGYVNFFLNRRDFAKNLIDEILKRKDKFGKSNIGKGKKVLIEHTSINPNASPHLGRARNAIIGDSIVNIFSFLNFEPEVHYYVNDVSKQIAMLVMGDADKLEFKDMLNKYVEISKKAEEFQDQIFFLLRQFEEGDEKVVRKFNKITKTCVEGQKKILSELGIKYDSFDYESKYLKKSKKLLLELKETKKLHKDREGRFYLDQKSTIVRKKMKSPVLVLTRSDGTGLYPLRDIVYTMEKMKKAKKNLWVLGEDHKLYFLQIKEALKLLGVESPEVIHYSFILLKEKGKSKKMSTRKGEVILLEDFLEKAIKKAEKETSKRSKKGEAKKVAIGAVKYTVLKNHPNKSILFNLDDALKFEGDTGPYILYSYARASSILRKSKNKLDKIKNFETKDISESEIKLIKKLSQFPEIILKSYDNLNPSLIANYSYELAQTFNEFYHLSKVIGSKEELFRLGLVQSFRYVLKNSLNLLGIESLEKM